MKKETFFGHSIGRSCNPPLSVDSTILPDFRDKIVVFQAELNLRFFINFLSVFFLIPINSLSLFLFFSPPPHLSISLSLLNFLNISLYILIYISLYIFLNISLYHSFSLALPVCFFTISQIII